MKPLRHWQEIALMKIEADDGDQLLVAAPATGKTLVALTRAKLQMDDGRVRRVVVVVPTSHLKRQWAKAAHTIGLKLDHRCANGNLITSDFDGAVITYQSVTREPTLWRKLSADALVIFDEIHHCGEADHLTWGQSIKEAFGAAPARLLLSGTPFRTDGEPIPFVRYDDQGVCIATYTFSYGQAISEGCVRPIEFYAEDSEVEWVEGAREIRIKLSAACSEQEISRATLVAMDTSRECIYTMLQRGDEELTRHRLVMPDAGGLAIFSDLESAKKGQRLLGMITGEAPDVVLSDDPDASKIIERFSSSKRRWIVAVRMISEGVDIPRLTVGVWATNWRTLTFFRQFVGRFVRKRSKADEMCAAMFFPAIQPLLEYARDVEKEAREALQQETSVRCEWPEDEQQRESAGWYGISASAATLHAGIRSSQQCDEAVMMEATELRAQTNYLPPSLSDIDIALVLQARAEHLSQPRTEDNGPLVGDVRDQLRSRNNKLVGRLANMTGREFAHISADANRAAGITSVKDATIAQLERRAAWLRERIAEA